MSDDFRDEDKKNIKKSDSLWLKMVVKCLRDEEML